METTKNTATKRIYSGHQNREVLIDGKSGCYRTLDGEVILRLEIWGRYGKVLHKNGWYLDSDGREMQVHGMDGATFHGWGGRVAGYATLREFEERKK